MAAFVRLASVTNPRQTFVYRRNVGEAFDPVGFYQPTDGQWYNLVAITEGERGDVPPFYWRFGVGDSIYAEGYSADELGCVSCIAAVADALNTVGFACDYDDAADALVIRPRVG